MHFFVVFFFENLGGVVARFRIGIALRGEGIALLVVQVLLDVEERVEEDVGQLASFQVPQGDLTWTGQIDIYGYKSTIYKMFSLTLPSNLASKIALRLELPQ